MKYDSNLVDVTTDVGRNGRSLAAKREFSFAMLGTFATGYYFMR